MSVKVKISEIPDAENLQDFYTIGTKYNDDGSKESVKMPLQFLEEGEDARRAAEEKRIEAEKAREAAEGKRASAENTRQSNEQARQSAESARASAENTRKSNEATRQSNEAARQSAESKRASAESDRETAEVARATAEKARAAAEGTRTANEETRQSAEAARQSAEDTRKSNEASRQNAENTRVDAESKRVTAESDRAKSETARETASSEAVKNAQKATEAANNAATAANNAASRANTVADGMSGEIDALKTELEGKISAESAERGKKDTELQGQIDAIESRSDVVDVVADYAALEAYDKGSVTDKDIIKVLADEKHEGATSYYRIAGGEWTYVGQTGPYYTKAEADTKHNALSEELAKKADKSALAEGLAEKSDAGHGHVIDDVTGLQDTLNGKAASSHTHTKANIIDFPTALKNPAALKAGSKSYDGSTEVTLTAGDLGAAAAGHTHSYSDLTNRPTIPGPATQSADGLMSATDKKKLDGMNIWTGTESEYDTLGSKSATTLYFIRKS